MENLATEIIDVSKSLTPTEKVPSFRLKISELNKKLKFCVSWWYLVLFSLMESFSTLIRTSAAANLLWWNIHEIFRRGKKSFKKACCFATLWKIQMENTYIYRLFSIKFLIIFPDFIKNTWSEVANFMFEYKRWFRVQNNRSATEYFLWKISFSFA